MMMEDNGVFSRIGASLRQRRYLRLSETKSRARAEPARYAMLGYGGLRGRSVHAGAHYAAIGFARA
jgi:hypothetical protein